MKVFMNVCFICGERENKLTNSTVKAHQPHKRESESIKLHEAQIHVTTSTQLKTNS